jgi:hypothetical protein
MLKKCYYIILLLVLEVKVSRNVQHCTVKLHCNDWESAMVKNVH